ncbi:MAG: M23 family metallopeptidase [Gammaproteobacteria bacterium]|nr:M23 family metallopeptidase [Gammaproteobacteria bacterium]
MNIILCTKNSRNPSSINISQGRLIMLALLVMIVFPAAMMVTGYQLGAGSVREHLLPANWKREILHNRAEISEAARAARENMNALTLRLGQLQAQTLRLNALGQRLVESGRLDKAEFDFSRLPGQGGAESGRDQANVPGQIQTPDFMRSLDRLAVQLDAREQQLRVMENFFMNRDLKREIVPNGRPVQLGWLSSYYGMRIDPFTGGQEWHKGVDFAGKLGSDIESVATGVVTWSGKRYGYGLMVEINHGNGYATRYAHAAETLVKVGDIVKKGDVIARLGSSGRSTGPHVHYEVVYKGRAIDPLKFIAAR